MYVFYISLRCCPSSPPPGKTSIIFHNSVTSLLEKPSSSDPEHSIHSILLPHWAHPPTMPHNHIPCFSRFTQYVFPIGPQAPWCTWHLAPGTWHPALHFVYLIKRMVWESDSLPLHRVSLTLLLLNCCLSRREIP